MAYDLLIRNASLYDGSGARPVRGGLAGRVLREFDA
jgi:N-acyl-D-aspartate/D-glutamate deacylase